MTTAAVWQDSTMFQVLHVESSSLLREAVALVLQRSPDLRVIASLDPLAICPQQLARLSCDVALVGVGSAGDQTTSLLTTVCSALPSVPVMAHGTSRDPAVIGTVLCGGARGFVHQDVGLFALFESLRRASSGDQCIVRGLDGAGSLRGVADQTEKLLALTSRELQILRWIVTGCTSREIADVLGISPRTVDAHRRHLVERLGVDSRRELVQAACRGGLVPRSVLPSEAWNKH